MAKKKYDHTTIISIIVVIGAIWALYDTITSLVNDPVAHITSIIGLIFAVLCIVAVVKPERGLYHWLIFIIFGIVIALFGSLIGGIIVIIGGVVAAIDSF